MVKNIIHTDVWKKGDERTTYNMIYLDGGTGRAMAKRFNVKAITREKDYNLSTGARGSRVLYFTAQPNGETEIVRIQLSPGSRAKKKVFEFDFDHLDIKGRGSKGNIVTRYPVRKIDQVSVGQSTLGALKIWVDLASGRFNTEERGQYLGEFDTGDLIISLYDDGTYQLTPPDPVLKIQIKGLLCVSKLSEDSVVSVIYYDGEKEWSMAKRFQIETSTLHERIYFLTDHPKSRLIFASLQDDVHIEYSFMRNKKKEVWNVQLDEFIDVKGWKARGNKLSDYVVKNVSLVPSDEQDGDENAEHNANGEENPDTYQAGDTIEFEF